MFNFFRFDEDNAQYRKFSLGDPDKEDCLEDVDTYVIEKGSFFGIEVRYKDVKIDNLFGKPKTSKTYYYTTSDDLLGTISDKQEVQQRFGIYSFFAAVRLHNPVISVYDDNYQMVQIYPEASEFAIYFTEHSGYTFLNICPAPEKSSKIHISRNIGKIENTLEPERSHFFIEKPEVLHKEMLEYYIFDGLRFKEGANRYIKPEKERIKNILDGLNYCFAGTSIFDYAKDIDIYVWDTDYEEAITRLRNYGYLNKYYKGCPVGLFYTDGLKIDIIKTNLKVPTNNNQLTPEGLYLTLCYYYTDVSRRNLTDFFKTYRFNKVLEIKNRLNLDDYGFENYTIPSNRIDKYVDILNDCDYGILQDPQTSLNCKARLLEKAGYFYIFPFVKDGEQTVQIFIEGSPELEVIDSESFTRLICEHDPTCDRSVITIKNLEGGAILRWKKY